MNTSTGIVLTTGSNVDPWQTLAGVPLALRAVLTLQTSGISRVILVGPHEIAAAVRSDTRVRISVESAGTHDAARTIAGGSAVVARHDLVAGERVDTDEGRRRAVDVLFEACRKPVDGVVSRNFNRHISIAISKRLVDTPVTPNQISVIALFIGLVGAVFASWGGYAWPLAGAVLLQINAIIDGVDGELARVRFQQSRVGEWLDNLSDDITSVAFWAGLAVGASGLHPWLPAAGWVAVGSHVAFVALTYGEMLRRNTGTYFDIEWYDQTQPGWRTRVMKLVMLIPRRDFFVFFCLCAAVAGVLFYVLPVIAVASAATLTAAVGRNLRELLLRAAPRGDATFLNVVVLAAGRSTRLRPLTDTIPKCLLPVVGIPILRRMLAIFAGAGVRQVVIVTGYREDQIRGAVAEWKLPLDVRFVHNERWETTNNCYSLLLGAEALGGAPFMTIDGDVVFERGVIESVLRARGGNRFALRRAAADDDLGDEEMKVELHANGRLRAIGKTIPAARAAGEAVGVWLFESGAGEILAALRDRILTHGLHDEWYEASFQQAIDRGLAVTAVEIDGYMSEIDTLEDLERVEREMSTLA